MRACVLALFVLVGGCSAIVDAPGATYGEDDPNADAGDGGVDPSASGEGRGDGGTTDASTTDASTTDAALTDGAVDADTPGGDTSGLVPTALDRSVLVPTSGGGPATSSRFRAVLVIGGPTGQGVAAGANHRLHLGTAPMTSVQ